MKKLLGLFTAISMTANSVGVLAVNNGDNVSGIQLRGGSLSLEANGEVCDIITFVSDPYDDSYGMGIAEDNETKKALDFYSYSNKFYEEEYKEYSKIEPVDPDNNNPYGHGWAYYDIMGNTRIGKSKMSDPKANREDAEQRRKFYDDLLIYCEKFAADYTDVKPTYYYDGNGDYFERYQLPGTAELKYNMSLKSATETYFMFRNDHPEYYWLSNKYAPISSSTEVYATPELAEDFRSGEYRKALDERIQESLDWFIEKLGVAETEFQKVALAHDLICKATDYGWKVENRIPLDTPLAHSIAGVLDADVSSDAVCEGYARTLQLLCNKMGIESVYVTGDAGGGHAWNMVKIGDEFYLFDATWADQTGRIDRSYFAQTSEYYESEDRVNEGQHKHIPYPDTYMEPNNDIVLNPGDRLGENALFLYALPDVAKTAYSFSDNDILESDSLADKGIVPVTTPNTAEVITPIDEPIWITVTDLVKAVPKTVHYSNFGSVCRAEISVKNNGQSVEYGKGFYAAYDGKNLAERYFNAVCKYGKLLGEDVDYTKLVIKVSKGYEVTVIPSFTVKDNDAGAYYPDITELGNTIIAGETLPWYGYEYKMSDAVKEADNKMVNSPLGEYTWLSIAFTEGLSYGTDYYGEYDGAEIINEWEFRYAINGSIDKIFSEQMSYKDMLDKMVIRSREPITMTVTPCNDEGGYKTDVFTVDTKKRDEESPLPPAIAPIENPVEIGIPTPTEEPTEDPTQAPTEVATEKPTEAPTEEPTATPFALAASLGYSEDGSNIVIKADKDIENAQLIKAVYNNDHVLERLELTELSLNKNVEKSIDIGDITSKEGGTYKFMLMYSLGGVTPISKSTELKEAPTPAPKDTIRVGDLMLDPSLSPICSDYAEKQLDAIWVKITKSDGSDAVYGKDYTMDFGNMKPVEISSDGSIPAGYSDTKIVADYGLSITIAPVYDNSIIMFMGKTITVGEERKFNKTTVLNDYIKIEDSGLLEDPNYINGTYTLIGIAFNELFKTGTNEDPEYYTDYAVYYKGRELFYPEFIDLRSGNYEAVFRNGESTKDVVENLTIKSNVGITLDTGLLIKLSDGRIGLYGNSEQWEIK